MWDWIKSYNVPFYETFWMIRGQMEYEFIYRKKVSQEIKDILAQCGKSCSDQDAKTVLENCTKAVSSEASNHFGQPYFNTATIAGLYRMMLKSLAAAYGVTFPLPISEAPKRPWYVDYMFF